MIYRVELYVNVVDSDSQKKDLFTALKTFQSRLAAEKFCRKLESFLLKVDEEKNRKKKL